MKLAAKDDILFIDFKTLKYANVIFNTNFYKYRGIILKYIKKLGIISIGRFGEWDYLWSDQSLLSGLNVVDKLKHKGGVE